MKRMHMQNPKCIASQGYWWLFLQSGLILTQALKEQITQHNDSVFTKSRAITLQILDKSTSEIQDAQLHMLTNIPVKFHDFRLNTFWGYTQHKLKIANFHLVKGNYSDKTYLFTSETPDAKLHMLSNIPVKFHDASAITL
jgi:hypothetical protein